MSETTCDSHAATHCNTLQHTATQGVCVWVTPLVMHTHCNTLQHAATHCNTLQHTATQGVCVGDTTCDAHTVKQSASRTNGAH